MLNYKELSKKFTAELMQFDREMLVMWMNYDEQRETVRRLSAGEGVWFESGSVGVNKLSNNIKTITFDENFDDSYSSAA